MKTNVIDIATYILSKTGEITCMKLQKLVYYCQAWSLVWDLDPLFSDEIQAWANGPVVPRLFRKHQGDYTISELDGNIDLLNENQKETIDEVIKEYGDKTSKWLSDLTHMETPWLQTRGDLLPTERSEREIPLQLMQDYYASL